jgi:mannosylglycoprotein endo-beta-mannosidase
MEGDDNLLKHTTKYYAALFGPEIEHNIHIDNIMWQELPKVSEEENIDLCKPFSESEIKTALFSMEKNKATGPDKIPIEFYQSCWEIVKNDIVKLFHDFHKGNVDISRINYEIITLLPKVTDASRIQQFRPICLLNCLYKLITKTLTIRVEKNS